MATKHEPPESPIRNPQRDQRSQVQRQPGGQEGDLPKAEGEERRELLEEKPYDFIERTKPEDRLPNTSNNPGQMTRDNVNPHIPSVPPEAVGPAHARIPNPGGIVDPHTLGMDQSQQGEAPPEPANKVEQWPNLGLDHTKNPADEVQEAANRQRQLQQEGKAAPGQQALTQQDLENHLPSINEPPGSDIYAGVAGEVNLPPLDLEGVNPDSAAIGSAPDVTIAVHGTGFTPNSVVLVDDEEMPTTFVNTGKLTAQVPMATEPGEVDVEVQRGDDLSEILTFEFLAAEGGTRSRKEPERKPKKSEPSSKRTKKKK